MVNPRLTPPPLRIFLSHTADLRSFPPARSFVTAAEAAVVKRGHAVTDMAHFPAVDAAPADYCEARLSEADVYLGIIGLRYGSPVPGLEHLSYTELEFETATRLERKRLIFLIEDQVLPPGAQGAEALGRQEAFRQRLLDAGLIVAKVRSPAELELAVFHALSELVEASGRWTDAVWSRLASNPPSPPGSENVNRFVGRGQLLALVDELLARGTPSVIDCEGDPGMGKSQLLAQVHQRAKASGARSAWLRIADRDPSQDRGEQLAQDDRQYVDVAGSIAAQLLEDGDLAGFVRLVARHGWLWTGPASRSGAGETPRATDLGFPQRLADSRLAMEVQLAAGLQEIARRGRVVVLVDNYHHAMGNARLRAWLGGLLQRVASAGALVVVCRRPEVASLFVDDWPVERHLLPPLDEHDVQDYLRLRVRELDGDDAAFSLAADTVTVFSGGHPLAMEAAAERILFRPPGETVQEALRWIAVCQPRQVAALVEHMGLPNDQTRLARAFEAACVLRRFDARALAAVMDPQDVDGGGNLATQLAGLPGVTVVGAGHTYAFHEFVRQQELGHLPPARRAALHTRAEGYYLGRARDRESRTGGSTYARFLRYDAPDWREAESEWLYHLAQGAELADHGQGPEVFITIATIYLEVFWWWGCYIRFPFCELLIRDLVYHARGREWQRWAHALRRFHHAYAPEEQPDETGDWDAVEAALLTLRDLGGLGAPLRQLDGARRRMHALTAVFLAHAYWRQDAADERIDRWYREAYRCFGRLDEYAWCLPWVRFERGELERERGHPAAAARHCAAGLRFAGPAGSDEEDVDHEVLANLHRLRGSLAAAESQVDAAAEAFAVAVREAYTFQRRPHPPDEYTRTFYEVVATAVLDELQAVAEAGGTEEAVRMARRLHDEWAPARGAVADWPQPVEDLVEHGDWTALRPCLFPRGPSRAELDGTAADEYESTVGLHLYRVREHRRRMGHGASA